MFKNKTIFVTGAADGIGLEVIRFYIAEGAKVIGTYKSSNNFVEGKFKEENLHMIKCDQTSMSDIGFVSATLENSGERLDICILNAGIAKFGLVENIKENDFDSVFNTNVKGNFFLLKSLIRFINENGCIILIGSVSWKLGIEGTSIYAASKASLYSLTKVLANELSERNIRVNLISPGVIDTGIFDKFGLKQDTAQRLKAELKNKTRFKRLGTKKEVAELIAYLSSDKAKYITGQEIIIDGGMSSIN